MKPPAVIDLVDKAWKVLGHILKGLVGHRVDRLHFERLHEALRLGVVVRIAAPAHRADQTIGIQDLAIDLGCILRSAVGVMEASWRRVSRGDGRFECRHRQAGVDRPAERIAHDPA